MLGEATDVFLPVNLATAFTFIPGFLKLAKAP
jgi:hypothetical protein